MFGCMGKPPEMLQMHTSVTEAVSEGSGGTIACTPIGVEPIEFQWSDAWRNPIALELDASKSEASNVPPGDYYVTASDALKREVCVKVRVKKCNLHVVVGYEVENASTEVSRDGVVKAIIEPPISNVRYLWTTGAITNEPVLKDVKCGTYTVTLLGETDSKPIIFIHASNPAYIKVGGKV